MRVKNRKRLLLIAPRFSYRIAAYIEAANTVGVDIQIASDGKNSLVTELATGLHIDLNDIDSTLDIIQSRHRLEPFDAIIASDDRTVTIAAEAASRLGLTCNPPKTAQISRRKDLSRKTLARASISVPLFEKIDLNTHTKAPLITGFPCVLKPLSLSASTGVIRANNPAEFQRACKQIRAIIAYLPNDEENHYALVEQYLDGVEVAIEGMVSNSSFELLAIIDKPEPLTGPYFEESYYTTPSRLDRGCQQRLIELVSAACAALGIKTGPVHAECRINDKDCWILEVATRSIGGDCSKILQFIHEQSLEALVISNALGYKLPAGISNPVANRAAGVMMIPTPSAGILRGVGGLQQARKIDNIESVEIAIRAGHELKCLPQGSSYLGFIFARAKTPALVERALRQAFACLKIDVANLFFSATTATRSKT